MPRAPPYALCVRACLRLQVHPCIGSVTRSALRYSEELLPFLSARKAAYAFGPLAAAGARMIMWLLPGK